MRIALASPRIATSINGGLENVRALVADAAGRGAEIVCFPEAYVPGLRGLDFDVPPFTRADQDRVLAAAADCARTSRIAVIFGTELVTDAGRQIAAAVFDAAGLSLGIQTKTQIDPSEDVNYVPGRGRRLFEVGGVRFGVAICHEGWRYPETVRWAAVRGAKVVFHPQHTGYEREGSVPAGWAPPGGAYYEQAMGMRARENTVYFASVNYALRHPESATCVTGPTGERIEALPYGVEGVLVTDLDLSAATGLLASRYAPERYAEA